jgi:hypothetical protein
VLLFWCTAVKSIFFLCTAKSMQALWCCLDGYPPTCLQADHLTPCSLQRKTLTAFHFVTGAVSTSAEASCLLVAAAPAAALSTSVLLTSDISPQGVSTERRRRVPEQAARARDVNGGCFDLRQVGFSARPLETITPTSCQTGQPTTAPLRSLSISRRDVHDPSTGCHLL